LISKSKKPLRNHFGIALKAKCMRRLDWSQIVTCHDFGEVCTYYIYFWEKRLYI